jgi:putative flippase GtrA
VADVPFVFERRRDGESKASAKQGWLYVRHLLSLFLHVPDSSPVLKFVLISICGLAVFEALFLVLTQTGLPILLAWAAASLGSSLLNAMLQRHLTFWRGWWRPLPYRAFGSLGSLVGLAGFAALLLVAPGHPRAAGAAAQGLALLVPLAVNLLGAWRRLRALTHGPAATLMDVARRLDADTAWWSEPAPPPLDASRRRLAPVGLEELIRHSAQLATPDLVVQSPSDRPQPRRNVESLSAILVPKPHLGRVAVLVRRSVKALTPADLEQAVRLLHDPAESCGNGAVPLDEVEP